MLLFGGYYKEMKHKKLYDSSKSAGGKAMDDPDEPSEVGTAYNDGTQPTAPNVGTLPDYRMC